MDDSVKLITETFTVDSIGQRIASETKTEVFCSISSVGRTEWRDAGVNGLRAEMVVEMPYINYGGQEIVEWNNKRYTVYRTYIKDSGDTIELYLDRRVGA